MTPSSTCSVAGIGHGVVEQRHRPGDLHRVVDGQQAAAALLDGDVVELDVIQRQRGIERDRMPDAVAVEVGVGAAGAGDLAGAGDIDVAAAAAAEIVDGAAVDGGARQRQGDAVVDLQRGAGIGHGVVEQRHRARRPRPCRRW